MTDEPTLLTERFEEQRPRLRAVAYRMLGSLSEADDAVQETWLRASRSDLGDVQNLPAWLTTVVARVSLNLLRSRLARREEPMMPDPIVGAAPDTDPADDAVLADAVGLALLIVLETLAPAERLAFVLHDMFAVPFEQIAPMVDRSPAAVRQMASRARRRVKDQAPAPDPDVRRQRAAVDAFFAASKNGDLDRLAELLHPDVVLRVDGGQARRHQTTVLHGSEEVMKQARLGARMNVRSEQVVVNGGAGVVIRTGSHVLALMAFTVTDGRIAAIDVLSDPARLKLLGV